MSKRPSRWTRRRGSATVPKPGGSSKISGTQVAAIIIILLIAISGVYYYVDVYSKPSGGGYFSERVRIDIGGYYYNSSDPADSSPAAYYPNSFNVTEGAHITLAITNTDNLTHGLAVPKFNVDTGPMQPNATTTLSFVASPVGNYSYYEPSSDCGGGNCDTNSSIDDLTGWFLVVA